MNDKEKEFLKAIRLIVKHEFKVQMENFKLDVTKLISENSKNNDSSALSFLYENPGKEKLNRVAPKRTYVHDSVLNDILNDVGPLNEGMSSANMVSYDTATDSPIITGINGENINPSNENVQKVLDITQKDYSAVLKKMKEKTGRI